MANVKIDPAFGDEHMEGEYDDSAFMQADQDLQDSIARFIAAGGRSDNLETCIATALEDILS